MGATGQPIAGRLTERRQRWSERLTATVELDRPADIDNEIARLFTAAAANG